VGHGAANTGWGRGRQCHSVGWAGGRSVGPARRHRQPPARSLPRLAHKEGVHTHPTSAAQSHARGTSGRGACVRSPAPAVPGPGGQDHGCPRVESQPPATMAWPAKCAHPPLRPSTATRESRRTWHVTSTSAFLSAPGYWNHT